MEVKRNVSHSWTRIYLVDLPPPSLTVRVNSKIQVSQNVHPNRTSSPAIVVL